MLTLSATSYNQPSTILVGGFFIFVESHLVTMKLNQVFFT